MPERLPGRDETFICPMCFDAQAVALSPISPLYLPYISPPSPLHLPFICPMCFDAQAEIADDYISDQFLADTFGGAAASASADYDADYSADYSADYAADYAGIEGFAGMPDLSSIDAAL